MATLRASSLLVSTKFSDSYLKIKILGRLATGGLFSVISGRRSAVRDRKLYVKRLLAGVLGLTDL
jgi:hypothetical protein